MKKKFKVMKLFKLLRLDCISKLNKLLVLTPIDVISSSLIFSSLKKIPFDELGSIKICTELLVIYR